LKALNVLKLERLIELWCGAGGETGQESSTEEDGGTITPEEETSQFTQSAYRFSVASSQYENSAKSL
jgi:hypothetical protein